MYSTREISPDAMWKPAGNKGKHTKRQRTETSGSTWEHDWVVGSQILTMRSLSTCLVKRKVTVREVRVKLVKIKVQK